MSIQRRRHYGRWCSIELMNKPWFIDALTYGIVAGWMIGTYALIQQEGTGPWLLGSAVTVLVTGLLLIYNQRVAYLRIGDWLIIGTQESLEDDPEE